MKKSSKIISLIMVVSLIFSMFTISFASAVELKEVTSTIMERPSVTFVTSGITRVAETVGSQKLGNVIVKATPSGVPEMSGDRANLAYDGETPVATTVSFSTDYAVEGLTVTCTDGAEDLVLSQPVKNGNTTVWTVLSGKATAGNNIEFTATYTYGGNSYVSRCYSYVKNVIQGGLNVRTECVYSGVQTLHRYYAITSTYTRLLGVGVDNTLSTFESEVGYYDIQNGSFTTDKSEGYTATRIERINDSKTFNENVNNPAYIANVYVDTSSVRTLADLNLRLNVLSCARGANNDYPGSDIKFEAAAAVIGDNVDATSTLGYSVPNIGSKFGENQTITSAPLTGAVNNINDGDTFTLLNRFYANNDGSWWGEAKNTTYVPTTVSFHLVDKGVLRNEIAKVLNSDPVSPLISNANKGANPQSWYYKSGYTNFKTALANAYAALIDDTADQNTIDTAAESLDMMYSNLVLNSADYSTVNSLLEKADEALENSEVYTADSIELLNNAYDMVKYNYNILFQSSVDVMAENLQTALDNLAYAPADYTAVDTAIANADTSAFETMLAEREGETITFADTTISVLSEEFVASVSAAIDTVNDAVDAVVTGLDITEQAQVDGFAAAISDAYTALTTMSADYTAANAVKAYAMALNPSASNYKNFTAVRTAVNKIKTGYTIDKQAEVDGFAKAVADALNALQLKDATKTALKTALDLTPAYDKVYYDSALYEAWETVRAEAQTMYDDTTLTILDNATITAKAGELTAAFNALKAHADLAPLTEALALVPEYDISNYTAATAKAYTDAVAAGNDLIANAEDLTPDDNAVVASLAGRITNAYNNLTLKDADYTDFDAAVSAFESASEETVSVVTYEVGGTTGTKNVSKYTADSLAAVQSYIDECDTELDIISQATVNEYALTISDMVDALTETVDKSELEKAVAEIETLVESDYTVETWSVYSEAIANAGEVATQEDVNNAVTAIAEARANLEEEGYVFIPEVETTTVIDAENKFIYGLEEGITDLEGFVEYDKCEINCVPTEAGFGTGSTVEVIYKGQVVETYTVVIFGDVTGDGYIDAFDAAILVSVANFESELDEDSAYALAGDLTGDGFIDSFDTAMLISASNFEIEIPQTI